MTGYPKKTTLGMNDPASHVGFTADGNELAFCDGEHYPAGPRHDCELLDRSNKKRRVTGADAIALKKGLIATDGAPPPLAGSWPYTDIELVVDDAAQGKSGATVRLGATIAGESRPVYSVFVSHASTIPDLVFHTAWVDALVLSPDGSEIGLVAGFECMEWCNELEGRRFGVGELAAIFYSDAGMRHHDKGEWARARELFTKAVHADPRSARATYNLACALARQDDPLAERALDRAVQLGGDAIRAKARTDADFAGVRARPWFETLVHTSK